MTPANLFELREVQASSEPRHEIKYAMVGADYRKLSSILGVNLDRVHYREASSLVSSIYFDDAGLSCLHENMDGVGQRVKLRLRWYDDDDEKGVLVLEVKRRRNTTIEKMRVPLRAKTPLGSVSLVELVSELKTILPAAVRTLLARWSEPTLVSEYRREYFEARSLPIRVTLDRELVSYALVGKRRPQKKFGARSPEIVVVEVKFPAGMPHAAEAVRELLYPLEPKVTRFSKYVFGCERAGLVTA